MLFSSRSVPAGSQLHAVKGEHGKFLKIQKKSETEETLVNHFTYVYLRPRLYKEALPRTSEKSLPGVGVSRLILLTVRVPNHALTFLPETSWLGCDSHFCQRKVKTWLGKKQDRGRCKGTGHRDTAEIRI